MALEPLYLKVAAYAAMSCYCLLRDADLPGGAEGGVDAATDLFAFWVNGRQRNRYDHILNQVAADLRRLAEAEYRAPDAAEPVLVTVQDLLRHYAPRSRELVGAGLAASAIATRILADGRARGRLGRPGDVDEGLCRRVIEQVYTRLLAERAFLESLELEVTRAVLRTPERTADELERRGVSRAGMEAALRTTLTEIGLTSDLLARLDRSEESAEERRRLKLLEERARLTNSALTSFFQALGEEPVSEKQLKTKLVEIAKQHRFLTIAERLRQLSQVISDPVVARLHAKAAMAVEAGRYDRADALLKEAEVLQTRAIREQQETLRVARGRLDE